MSFLWTSFLEVFQVGLFGLTQFYGGQLGAAIITFSLVARLALLPFSVRLALRGRAHARRLRALRPKLLRIRERFAEDPQRQVTETLAVYEKAGVSPVDSSILRGSLLQSPVFLGLFHAVRGAVSTRPGESFLWITSLARPDVGIAVVVAGLMGLGAVAGASEGQPTWLPAVAGTIGAVMALTLSAGFGLYLAASGAVSTLQGLIVRRIDGAA